MICELYMYITIHIISFSFIIFAYIFESIKKKADFPMVDMNL